MQVFIEGIAAIVGFVQKVVTIIFNALLWLLDAVMWVVVQLIITITQGLFTIVHAFVSVLDLGSLGVNAAAAWGLIDSNIAGAINAMGFPTGLSIIGSAVVIRMVMNLIPGAITRI